MTLYYLFSLLNNLSSKNNKCKLFPAPTDDIKISNTSKALDQVLRAKAEVIAFVALEHQVICVYFPSAGLCKKPNQ